MDDLKNKVTNVCGYISGIATAFGVFAVAMNLPTWATAVCGLVVALCGTTVAFFTGRNADGSKKTPDQLAK